MAWVTSLLVAFEGAAGGGAILGGPSSEAAVSAIGAESVRGFVCCGQQDNDEASEQGQVSYSSVISCTDSTIHLSPPLFPEFLTPTASAMSASAFALSIGSALLSFSHKTDT